METEAVRVVVVRDDHLLLMRRNKYGHQYYTLVGGHIEPGEAPLAAMLREVAEETGLQLANPRLVYEQTPVERYNKQYIYVAEYVAGEVALSADSDEHHSNQRGENTYQPLWMPIDKLPALPFLPRELGRRVWYDARHGFPSSPITITPQGD